MECNHRGFTLIEVLIALAVIAIALLAITIAIDRVVQTESYLKQKNAALVLAQNILFEKQAGLSLPLNNLQTKQWGSHVFQWKITQATTPTPNVSIVTVQIYHDNPQTPILTLTGFSL